MPLHGKVVVIKRSGVDGTEFPLTAACVFGRKAECDIRIQLPQVSKEHCKIDLNENKEVIITNLSSVNPTRINGDVLQQSERLKHGDLITIFDRSFRFEYPPEPTPKKKRASIGGKTETLRVLQDKQARDTTAAETVDKPSETPSYPCLKDGTNNDNIQRTPEKTAEVETTDSPFSDLYQMIKKTLDSKSPWKPSGSQPQTPATRFCTPQPVSVRKAAGEVATLPKAEECTPMQVKAEESSGITAVEGDAEVESVLVATPKSVKKENNSSECELSAEEKPLTEQAANPATPVQETPKPKQRSLTSQTPTTVATSSPLSQKKQATPKKCTATQMIEQISVETPTLTPTRRKSKVATPIKPAVTDVQDQAEALPTVPSTPKTNPSPRHSPRTAEKKRQAQEATPAKPAVTEMQDQSMVTEALPSTPKTNASPRHSPRTAEKKRKAQEVKEAAATVTVTATKKRKSEELGADVAMTMPQMKRKRVSFGGHLSPELFDKRMPPDSPLRKGAAPRRSLCVPKSATSLLRRSSVSGFPKAKTPSPAKKSPKAKTPSPAKKSPKAKAKTPSPAKKSPKAKTPSPAKKSPKAKTPSPAKKSPKAKTPSPAKSSPKAKTPSPAKKSPKVKSPSLPETPTVQGRFSVSCITTPSPVAEETISAPEPSATMTPKLPLRRKSMKSTSRKSNAMAKNVAEVMRRRSGVSRASLKAQNSWADIVKFGQTKSQVLVQKAKKPPVQIKKKAVQPKHKTPAKNVMNYASTGHADSPVSIVVGRAHKRHVQPTGAAPRLVHNIALLKNMKMDEDLTGVAEIFNTPVGAKQRKSSVVSVPQSATKTPVSTSVIEASSVVSVPQSATKTPVSTSVIEASSVVSVPQSATKTPVSTSVVEASVMNTPEETGEMMVSPLAVASSAKSGKYNHEAVERLFLDDDESNFVREEVPIDDVIEQLCPDVEAKITTTPQQKLPQPDCLTGVKRLLKTPRQKPEPVEDLRGKLLKTPKQKAEQVECLTGVKRIMRTPRQKAEPVEDIRGKLLMTPKAEKPEQPECLSGVKRMMKTPKQNAEPVVDLGGELLKTPKAPAVMEEVSVGDIGELLETPIHREPPKDLIAVTDATPEVRSSLLVCNTDAVEGIVNVESLMKTPKEEVEPVDGLMKTPKQMEEPAETPKRVMKTPRLSANHPVEELQEQLEEPLTNDDCVQMATIEGHDELHPQNESDDSQQEPEVGTVVPVSVDDVEMVKEIPVQDETNTSLPAEHEQQPTATVPVETASQEPEVETSVPDSADDAEVVQEIPVEAENDTSLPAEDEQQSSEHPTTTVETGASQEPEVETSVPVPEVQDLQPTITAEKPSRGGRAKTVVTEEIMLKADVPEEKLGDAQSSTAIEGREVPVLKTRGRGRKAKQDSQESSTEPEVETIVPVSGDVTEVVQDIPVKAENTSLPAEDEQQLGDAQSSTAIEKKEKPVLKMRGRGRKAKQDSQESSTEPEVETIVPVSGDVTEVVQDIPVKAENTSLPAEDEQQLGDAQSSTAIEEREKPVLKTRGRGRKAKQDSQESSTEPEVETIVPVSGDVTEVVQDIPVKAENTSLPAEDEQQLGDAQSSTAIEKKEKPVLKMRGRGRKAKQDSQESSTEPEVETIVPVSGDVTEVVQDIPVKAENTSLPAEDEQQLGDAQSSTAIEEREKPVLKTRGRGRKAKQDSQESSTEPEVETIVPVSGDVAEVVQEIPVEAENNTPLPAEDEQLGDDQSSIEEREMPVLKPRGRGRKAKVDLAETQEAHEEAVPAEKPRRGGRKIKAETKSVVPHESTEVLDKPLPIATETPKKGITVTEQTLVTEEPEEKPATTSAAIEKIELPVLKTRGRGRKAKQDLPEAVETQEVHKDALVIPQEEAVDIPAAKARRGGRITKQEAVEAQEAHEEAVVIPHEAVVIPPEEAVIIPAEKPRRGGRKPKQDTQVVAPPESTDAQDIQPTMATEKPKRGARAKTATVVKEVEIMLEAEPAKEDVPEEKLDDQSSTAVEEKEMPVLKTRGRPRKAKQELPEAETQEPRMETLPAEKPKRGGRKKGSTMNEEALVKEVVIVSEEPEEKPDEHTQDDVQEENTVDVQTAATPTPIKKRGRKAKQDLPEAVETEEAHEEEIIPAEKPKRGGRKIKQETKSVLPTDPTEVQDKPLTITTEESEEKPEPAQDDVEEEKSGDAPVKARKGRKVNSAVDDSQATPSKRARRGETLPSVQEAEVVETAVPVTKSAARGRGRPKSEDKSQDADSKTKVSAGPVRKGRKATPPADDTVVVPSTEEVMEELKDESQSKKSVMWKDDLTETHVISPAVRAVRGRKPKPADNVPSPRPSPVKRDQSVESTECPASEATALTKTGSKRKAPRNVSKAQEEDLSNETVPSEPTKSRAKRVKATDAALVEIVTPATEVPETKPRRGRPAKK